MELNMNKKGMGMGTIIIILVAVVTLAIIVPWVINFFGGVMPAISGYSCGLNTRIDAAVLDNSKFLGKPLLGAPIILCNQWRTPININAGGDYKACPEIASFCHKSTGKLQEECWKQCARMQIDKLTDNCWAMAGSGKLDFTDSWLQGFTSLISDPFKLGLVIFTGGVGWYVGGPLIAKLAIAGGVIGETYFYGGTGEKILRCYRFRIVNPIVNEDNKPINYGDDSLGRSWAYGLNSTNLGDLKYCRPTVENPMCSFGGEGVSNINELGEIKYKVNGKDITVPTDDTQLLTGKVLDYDIPDPRNQICYITYHQANEGPKIEWTDKDGNKHEVKINNKYVVRSCEFWSKYSSNPSYLN